MASKIAVEFGVSEKDLLEIKNKKNFINILKIPLYENRKERVFCYKFHDVIVRLAEISVTIKYGVVELMNFLSFSYKNRLIFKSRA